MTYHIDIQNATNEPLPLTDNELTDIAILTLDSCQKKAEITLRLVSLEEMTELNHRYRKKNQPTNVLAFPSNLPEVIELDCPFLGDVIICPLVLVEESISLNKSLKEHWSLILIHGILHLSGYDHVKEEDAVIMQSLEIKLLAQIGYANPYDLEETKLE